MLFRLFYGVLSTAMKSDFVRDDTLFERKAVKLSQPRLKSRQLSTTVTIPPMAVAIMNTMTGLIR